MAVYQVAKFSNNLKLCHNTFTNRFGKYVLRTKNKSLTHKSNTRKGLEIVIDTDFAKGFNKSSIKDYTPTYS